jgi:DNA-binding beta-propeller fold protein YncE
MVTGPGLLRADIRVGHSVGVRVLALDDATGAIFVASENDGRLYRIDPQTEDVTEGPDLWARDVVGAAGGSVYVVLDDPVRVARLDAETLVEVASAEITGTPTSARPIGGRLWVRTAERELVRMDLETLAALPEVPFDHGPGFLAEGPAGVWLTDLDAGEVVQVDPDTGRTIRNLELEGARGIAVGDGAVWVADQQRGSVVRIDPADGSTSEVAGVGRRTNGVAMDGDRVWVTTFGDGRVVGIDAAAMAIVTSIPVGLRPGSIVVAGDSVWVSVHQRAAVLRLDHERLRSSGVTTSPWQDTSVQLREDTHLLLRCTGSGDPTVVLFPRDGADIGEWAFVQPAVAATTRVCAYEPPADDSWAPANLTDAELSEAIRQALQAAGASSPFVVVGSQGGSVRAGEFARRFRAEVTGLVLVDPGPPSVIEAAVRDAADLPLVTVAEGPDAVRGDQPSAPQREPARVVDAILGLVRNR